MGWKCRVPKLSFPDDAQKVDLLTVLRPGLNDFIARALLAAE